MNQEELHDLIAKQQSNICQIVAYRNNEKAFDPGACTRGLYLRGLD